LVKRNAMIDCFGKHKLENRKGQSLEEVYNEAIKGRDESEHRAIANKVALDFHKELFNEMEVLKKQVKGQSFKPSKYESPDKSDVVKKITDEYNEKINALEKEVTQDTNTPTTTGKEQPLVTDPTSKGEGAKEPPKEPTEPIGDGKGKDRLNDKGILNHLVTGEKVPESAKEGFKDKGLQYQTKSQKEAEDVAKSVIDEYGIEDAVLLAEAQKFDGDVNSLIYAESLNRLGKAEESAKTPEEKFAFAKKFAEVGIKYDEAARKGGRFTSAINYFYKKSPLGIAMIENAKRKVEFEEWAKSKEKSWKEFFDEMMKDESFEAEVKEYAKGEMAKERAENRKARIKKVDDAFDAAKAKFQGGAMYSTIIPPQVITTALEGMKKAYHAGEKVAKLVQDAVDYISEKIGHDTWDKEKFRAEWEEKLKDKSEKRKFTDEEIKAKILDRFRKKLKGLNDSQKEDIVRKSFQKIVENGGLDYADFKKIIADITGRSELTAEEVIKLKELVTEANKVDEAAQKARTERTQASRKEYMVASIKAAKAQKELSNLLYSKPNIMQRLTSMIQLNTLGVVSLINNPVYNVWNQTTLRLPIGVVKSGVDKAIQLGSGGKVYPETNIFSIQAQKEFFSKLGLGTKEAFQQFFTGLNRPDYTAKEIQGQQIRPFSSLKDLWKHFVTKEKKLTKGQIIDKALQGSPQGIAAEVVARTLNLGDKPQRFAAEGAQASAFAKSLGLKDIDYDLFIDFPREEAYRAYKQKGLSDAEAGKKADYVRDIIIKEGQRSTFQQDNMLNDVLSSAFGQLNKMGVGEGTQQLLKSVTVSPYIKIPANAYWSYYNLVNPEVAFLQAMIYSGKAYAKRNKGDNSAAKDLNEAKYWFAHGAVGIATRAVVVSLVGSGIINTSNTGDDTKKEREGEQNFEQQGTINVDKLWATIHGEDPNKVKNGLNVQMRWFGHFGTLANAIERKNEEMTPEQKQNQADFWDIALGGMEVDALKDLNQGVFGNTSSLLTSIERGDFQSYGVNLINMFANVVHPASLAQLSRAQLPYVNKNKGDDFLAELKNNMLTRSSVLRNLTGKYPPSRISIWGEKMPKNDKALQFFGVSKANNDAFARPLYDDAKRTDNIAFFPPSVKPEIKRGDEIVKLPTKEAARLEEFVGQQRKNLIAPYINNMATFEGSNKTYSELSDEEKLKNLEILYKEGFKRGKELFLREYPQYQTPEDFVDKTEQELEIEENNKQLRESIKNK